MEANSKSNSRIDDYLSLHLFLIGVLRRLELQQHEDRQTIVLELEHESEPRYLNLTFEGVTGLEFLPNSLQPVPLYIRISDIAERQWEGKNYQISNAEQDVQLPFYCCDFQAAAHDYQKRLIQSGAKSDQEYEAEFELLMQELAELTKPIDEAQAVRDRIAAEQLKAETKVLRAETRAILADMGAKF